ncbi:MAG: YdcF family protein [Acetobacter aceti]|uniref:DUF218 domain-containing protein n=1 Tax=Acetobacter aceti TaxID=435 RepID=A0A1U9KF59_ACEAC|nr:YdcF family protein [Acetobacter aceti]AQS84443.1 hypothetical protein A0U92_06260 [Acetobacter aceti]
MLPVIVFGAALYPDGSPRPALVARVQAALRFGERESGRLYVVTGGVPQAGQTEAAVMAGLLLLEGVPDRVILREAQSADTCDSVIACTKLLRERRYDGPVAVVTSDFHMMRCIAMLRALGWTTVAVPAPSRADLSRWRRLWVNLREYPATAWDVLLVLIWRFRQ